MATQWENSDAIELNIFLSELLSIEQTKLQSSQALFPVLKRLLTRKQLKMLITFAQDAVTTEEVEKVLKKIKRNCKLFLD